jgi:uncharacterized protein YuzE
MEAPVNRQLGRLDVSYDREVDILYLSIGHPRRANTVEDRDGLLLLKDLDTAQVIGVTVLDYDQKFRRLRDLSWLMKRRDLPRDIVNYLIERTPAHHY